METLYRVDDRNSDTTVDAELIVSVNVSPDLENNPRALRGGPEEDIEGHQFTCKVAVELSSYATLRDVQIAVDVCKPLVVAQDFYAIPNLCKRRSDRVPSSPRTRVAKEMSEKYRRKIETIDRQAPGRPRQIQIDLERFQVTDTWRRQWFTLAGACLRSPRRSEWW